MMRDADKFWRDACAAAVQKAAAYIRSNPTCPRPALARHPKGRHMREYLDVLWLPSAESVAWINLTHREVTPSTLFMEAPMICIVAVNALAPRISHNFVSRFMRPHGCRPPRVDFRPGDGDTPAAFAHPPALLLRCHVSEVERWTLQAARCGLGWLLGETAPFAGGKLPSAHCEAPVHEAWTPMALEANDAWGGYPPWAEQEGPRQTHGERPADLSVPQEPPPSPPGSVTGTGPIGSLPAPGTRRSFPAWGAAHPSFSAEFRHSFDRLSASENRGSQARV
jgi:hypothetical protein